MKSKRKAAGKKAASRPKKRVLPPLYELLKKTEPTADEYDVVWDGPFWVDEKGLWHPTSFSVRRGVLHGQISLPRGAALMELDVNSGETQWIDVDQPGWPRGADYWPKALPQVHAELAEAVRDFDAYNQRAEREMPLASRTGKIQRHLTWTEGEERVPKQRIDAAREAVRAAARRSPLPALSMADYLRIAELVYDAAFPEEKHLPRAEKHRRHADGRHGGMLDLPPDDAAAFRTWFESRAWSGAHPFEIAYGHPHGILLWPTLEEGGWRFRIAISDELYLRHAFAMAIALDHAEIPFELSQIERLAGTFEGTDEVSVGPYRDQIPLAQIQKERPESTAQIRWDALPKLAPVTPDGRARIEWIEEHGTMAGFAKSAPTVQEREPFFSGAADPVARARPSRRSPA
jgi:hypothetical protein